MQTYFRNHHNAKEMKTEFDLDTTSPTESVAVAHIIGLGPDYRPYISIRITTPNGVETSACIQDKDMETFAVNILKALKSDKLTSQIGKSEKTPRQILPKRL